MIMWNFLLILASVGMAQGWTLLTTYAGLKDTAKRPVSTVSTALPLAATPAAGETVATTDATNLGKNGDSQMFEAFVDFLVQKQSEIIVELEDYEEGSATFSRDAWGVFDHPDNKQSPSAKSGGLTRVIQGGNIIEKGACSLTVIREGVLSADRASTIRARQDISIQEGDKYAAAALSMVLHSRSPHVPTFRSDVRVFCVTTAGENGQEPQTLAWFGGGADLTPYFLYDEDISFFHGLYKNLCDKQDNEAVFSYASMKQACDEYFYLPARSEHRGTGGIFFDDMFMDAKSLTFVKGVTDTWMPSWLPIVKKRQEYPVTERQRQWQLLRRGRYLEFNLLYDRGVKFGLANANPRVEGVMVSAPPLIAFEYNHKVEPGSEEARLLEILKQPKDWIGI